MKTNSTCKMLRNALMLFGVFLVSLGAVGQVKVYNEFYSGTFKVDGTTYTAQKETAELADGLHYIDVELGTDTNWQFQFRNATSVTAYGSSYDGAFSFSSNTGSRPTGASGCEDRLYFYVSGNTVQYSKTRIVLGPTITSVPVSAGGQASPVTYCSGYVELAVGELGGDNLEGATFSYQWQVKNNSVWEDVPSNGTSSTYTASALGDYRVGVSANGGSLVYSDAFTLQEPSGGILVSPASLTFTNVNGEPAQSKEIVVTNNSCDAVTVPATVGKFSIAQKDGAPNTYVITYNDNTFDSENSSENEASATITFTAGSATADVEVSGEVLEEAPCSETVVATIDFESGFGIYDGITITKNCSDPSGVSSTKITDGVSNNTDLVDNIGNAAQFYGCNDVTLFTISGLDQTEAYRISMLAGANSNNYYGTVTTTYKIGENTVGTIARSSSTAETKTISRIVNNVSSVTVSSSTEGSSAGNHVYFDNIVITQLCPPSVKITYSKEAECTDGLVFTASASAKSGSSINRYKWYKNGTPIAGAESNTYSPGEVLSTGVEITVEVEDDLGMKTMSKPYIYNCGPTIPNITAPAKICAGSALSLSAPSPITSDSEFTEGWEMADAEDGTYTTMTSAQVTALMAGNASYKNKWIRYYATNAKAKSVSNAVQITMFNAPVVETLTAPTAVCNGSALTDLTAPSVNADGATTTTKWQINNSGWKNFDPATELSYASYNGKNIRYSVTNQCNVTTNSNSVALTILRPTVSMDALPNKKAAETFAATVAEPSVTTNSCAGTLTYTLSGANADKFEIDASTGVVRTKTTTPVGVYTLTVTATEGNEGVSSSQSFTVTVVEDSPVTMSCDGGSETLSPCEKISDKAYTLTSHDLEQNVELVLAGDLASYFSVSPATITKNTSDQAFTFHQDEYLPLNGGSVTIFAKSNGVEYAKCVWEFTVNSGVSGTIATPTMDTSNSTNKNCLFASTMTFSASRDGLTLPASPCSGYPKYAWFLNGNRIGDFANSYSNLVINQEDIDANDGGDYTLRVYVGENAYVESPAYTLNYPLQMSIVGGESTFYCAEKVGVTATAGFLNYSWFNGTNSEGITESNTSSVQLKCGSNGDYLAVVARDNAGCDYTASVPITIRPLTQYYYCGATGASSNLTEPTNWCTSPSGTAGSCTSPSNFVTDGCEYIINKDGVELLEAQEWTVSGNGSKITVGNGKWDNGQYPNIGSGWETEDDYYSYMVWGALHKGAISKDEQVGAFTTVAQYDNRSYAKKLKISGILNTNENVTVDVRNGSALTIATDEGNFTLGTLATDNIDQYKLNEIKEDGKVIKTNGYDWALVNLGSSVTYTGDGAKRIRQGAYSQLYIEDASNIKFEQNAIVSIAQVLKNNANVSLDNVDPNGSTVQYVGIVNQDVAALKYYNLQTESASTKTLVGNIEVTNSLNIGAGSTLSAGNKNITVSGSGADAVVMIGKFDCGTSTFTYSSASETTVEAMNYYNLNLGNGARTLASHNHIGVAGTFTPGSGSKTITGSTVEFNGSSMQTIPAFTFYNLDLNNTASRANSNSLTPEFFVKQAGDVVIQNNLRLSEGILDTRGNQLLVTNTAASAIGEGYQKTADSVSFVVGGITRALPDNLTNSSAIYRFPIGDTEGYKPLLLNQLTTSVNPQVTVDIYFDGLNGSLPGGESVNSEYAWHVSGNNGYTSASVGVSDAEGLGSYNALAYGESEDARDLEDIYGTANNQGTLLYSLPRSSGYYALATRVIPTNKIYYYDCNGSDITNKNNWHKADGTTTPSSFSEIDAKWIIQCGATIDAPLTIDGSNSVVEIAIPKNQQLLVNSEVDFISATIKKGTVNVGATGVLTVEHDFKMDDIAAPGGDHQELQLVGENLQLVNTYSNRSSLINNGRVNLYLSKVTVTNSYIENNGYLYSENVSWDLSSDAYMNGLGADLIAGYLVIDNDSRYRHTQFINNSKIEMKNANIYVSKDSDQGAKVHIRNASNAVWMIDNTNASGLSYVTFDGTEFAHSDRGYNVAWVDFQCNSSFIVKHADVIFKPKVNIPSAYIGGDIIVEDGNMEIGRVSQAGGHVTLEQTCGNIYLSDTDNSGDGILTCFGTGGYTINVEGTLHAMGISVAPGASGSHFNVKNHGTVYIGNIGAMVPSYTWQFDINVEAGGTLYYCGNRTSEGDGIGTNAGNLYYAGNYYVGTNPIDEHDFASSGHYKPIFASEEQCMAAYRNGIPDADGRLQPIELTMLYGVCVDDNKVEIRWQTASETNNSHFTLFRSSDGVHFEEIGIVMGAGTTGEVNNYVYYDTDDNDGIVYYKLRQVDFDGNYADSKVIAVQTCGKNARFSIGSEEIEVFFRNPQANYVVITSVTGQIFYSKKFTNVEEARIAVPQRKGIYIISVIDSKQITSEKFIR